MLGGITGSFPCITVHSVAAMEYQIFYAPGASFLHATRTPLRLDIVYLPCSCFFYCLPAVGVPLSLITSSVPSSSALLLLLLLVYMLALPARAYFIIAPCVRSPLSPCCATAPSHAGRDHWVPSLHPCALYRCNGVPVCSTLPSSVLRHRSGLSSCYPGQCLICQATFPFPA
jgi:hypothetical protein